MKTVVIAIIIIALSFVLLGIKVLFIKGSRFPSGHVHDNRQLAQKGISCAHSDQKEK